MKIHNLSETNSLVHCFLREIRDKEIQQDSMRFRRNMERLGNIIAYELSKTLNYKTTITHTPLAEATTQTLAQPTVIASILRAGLPFHNGFLEFFDHAENAFVSAYRKYNEAHTSFEILVEYISSPSLDGKTLILCDPMLATGGSMELALNALLEKGKPAAIHIASIIASQQAIDYVQSHFDGECTVWTAAIDPILNKYSYIVPGLGDAGDLAFGEKL